MELIKIPLIEVGQEGISQCEKLEKKLEHIPNMKSLDKPITFSWDHRHLFIGQSYRIAGFESMWGDYMLYGSLNSGVGLPRNAHLKPLMKDLDKKGRMTAMEGVKIYGDAFLFRKKSKSPGSGEPERAAYNDMDEEFIGSMRAGSVAPGIVRNLFMFPDRLA